MRQVIKNRKGLDLVVLIKKQKKAKGTAVVTHGLGGFKEQLHIQTFAQAFEKKVLQLLLSIALTALEKVVENLKMQQ